MRRYFTICTLSLAFFLLPINANAMQGCQCKSSQLSGSFITCTTFWTYVVFAATSYHLLAVKPIADGYQGPKKVGIYALAYSIPVAALAYAAATPAKAGFHAAYEWWTTKSDS